jgi:hypothetical protein
MDGEAGRAAAAIAKEETRHILDRFGVTAEYLVKKLQAELDAQETKFFAYQGEVISREDVVAWDIRQKARQDAHKLRGDYAATQVDIGIKDVSDDALNARIKMLLEQMQEDKT